MQFAVLFVIAFLIGWLIYRYSHKWLLAVSVPMALFLISTLADHAARDAWAFTLIFGLPLVFFASLLGAYVVQIKDIGTDDEAETTADEGAFGADEEINKE